MSARDHCHERDAANPEALHVSVRLPYGSRARLDRMAREHGMSRAAFLRTVILGAIGASRRR